jgi:hypothetical protein
VLVMYLFVIYRIINELGIKESASCAKFDNNIHYNELDHIFMYQSSLRDLHWK